MRFMTHCRLACLLGLSAAIGVLSAPVHAEPPTRPLLICVAADAPPLVRQSADDILKAASSSPLMSTLAAQGASIADSATLVGDPKK